MDSVAMPGDRSSRNNNFDLIRLLAALQVLLIHAVEHLQLEVFIPDRLLDMVNWFPGVPIFFVVSGFLVGGAFQKNPVLAIYSRNRFLRIYPGMAVCLLVSVGLMAALHGFPGVSWVSICLWMVAQLTVGQVYNPHWLHTYGVSNPNGSLWTIPVEIQFYLLLPIVISFTDRHPRRRFLSLVLLGAFLAIAALSAQCGDFRDAGRAGILFRLSLIPYFYMFMIGVVVQQYQAKCRRWLDDRFIWWLAAYVGLCLYFKSMGCSVGGNATSPWLLIVLGGMTLSAAFSLPGLAARLLSGHDISYGIYLYHMVIINVLVETGRTGKPIDAVMAFAGTCILATASWLWVERPALRFKRRRTNPGPA